MEFPWVHPSNYYFSIDLDECMGEGSGNECEQDCANNPGKFNCTCFDGYGLVNETHCQGRIIKSIELTSCIASSI